MQDLLPLILIGFFMYLISRKGGGLGCCGGHGTQEKERHDDQYSKNENPHLTGEIIDLHENEYTVIDTKDNTPKY